VLEDAQARAEFSDGKSHLDMTVKDDIVRDIEARCVHHNEEEMAMRIYLMPDEELFMIISERSDPFGK
jgi:hypothetical protein